MAESFIPAFFYPGTIILLDDNSRYLKALKNGLIKHNSYRTFTQAKLAKEYLLSNRRAVLDESAIFTLGQQEDLEEETTQLIKLNLESYFINIVKDSNRFQENPVLVTDYAMPQIDGITFCEEEEIKNLPIKKIMLTGATDSNTAVKAFNKGIIDKFLMKEDLGSLLQELDSSIYQLQYDYFSERTKHVIDNLSLERNCCFLDPIFIEKFHEICKSNEIIEFYLIDKFGSYLLLDATGKAYILAVRSKDDLLEYIDLASHANSVSTSVLTNIKRYQQFPYFLTQEDYQTPYSSWGDYLCTATEVKGKHGLYYYSLIKDLKNYNLGLDEVVSFNAYLGEK